MHDPDDPAAPVGEPRSEQPGQLTVVVRSEQEATLVAVRGELDLLNATLLTAELDAILSADAQPIAIDLTEITFIDSAGIHVLVNARQRASRHLAVICGRGPVARALELLGLSEMLNVVTSLEDYKRRRAGS